MDDIVKKLIELFPLIREGPSWLQAVFLLWLAVTFTLIFGVVIQSFRVGSRPSEPEKAHFSVDLQANQYIEERQLTLTGHGLPKGAEIDVKVHRLSEGERALVPQERGDLIRKESGEWRYQWVRFEGGGEHELDVRLLQDGQPVDFYGPVRIYIGAWVTAPQAYATPEAVPSRPAPPVAPNTIDLSEWVTIHDQGREGTSPAVAAITAMETSLAWNGEPTLLSARYVYEKAKRHDELGIESEGTWLTAIAYIIQQFGVPPESAWPYSPGERALPEQTSWADLDRLAAGNIAHLYRLSSYDEMPGHLEKGRPILTGVRLIGKSWFSAGETQLGEISAPSPDDNRYGLHAIVVVAYNGNDSSIRFANSWGPAWGDDGFGTMTQEVAREVLLTDQMWAVEISH